MSIPHSVIPDVYNVAQRVFNNELTTTQGARLLVESHGLNSNSATTYIRNFEHMVNGTQFRRTLNMFSMRYYFERFCIDYGAQTLFNALSALRAHILYIEDIKHASNPSMRDIFDEYVHHLPIEFQDEFEQDEIEDEVNTTSHANLIPYLKNLKKTDDDNVMLNNKSYKRDNKTLTVIKKLRGFSCQICNVTILKRNGKFYIEAAHIRPRSLNGRETPDNIIVLCPNHHKEFDHGETEIIFQDSNTVVFTLNGHQYTANLRVE
jgi:5-methylcytosine-specific restriction protein A